MNTEKLNELKKRINAIIDEAINDSRKEVDRPNIEGKLSQAEALQLMHIGYTVNFPSCMCEDNKHMIINGNVSVCECYEDSNGIYSIDEWMDEFSYITGWRIA